MEERSETQAKMRVRVQEISIVGVQKSPLISWSSLSSVNSFNSVNSSWLEWEAKETVSVSGNESESARAIVINQGFWSWFNRLIVDALDRRRVNRRSEDSKNAFQVPLSLIKVAWLSLFFTKGKKILTRALVSTSFGHCNGWVVLKMICSSSSKRVGWSIGCGAFRIVKRST